MDMPEAETVVYLQPDASVRRRIKKMDPEERANVRRLVAMQTESLQEEWDVLGMLGLR